MLNVHRNHKVYYGCTTLFREAWALFDNNKKVKDKTYRFVRTLQSKDVPYQFAEIQSLQANILQNEGLSYPAMTSINCSTLSRYSVSLTFHSMVNLRTRARTHGQTGEGELEGEREGD